MTKSQLNGDTDFALRKITITGLNWIKL